MAPRRFGIELAPDRVAVWIRGDGLILDEPALLARTREGGRPLGIGTAALEAASGRGEEVELVWPVGVQELADQGAAEQLLRQLLLRVVGRLLFSRHELMLGVSAELATEGRRRLLQIALASGARIAHIIDLPLAAALGAGLPVAGWAPLPVLVVVPQAAQAAVVAHDGLLTQGYRRPPLGELRGLAQSWDSQPGLETLAELVLEMISWLPSELAQAARASGVALAGRGVTLARIAAHLSEVEGIPARVVADPQHCVAKGTEIALERIGALGSQGLLYLR